MISKRPVRHTGQGQFSFHISRFSHRRVRIQGDVVSIPRIPPPGSLRFVRLESSGFIQATVLAGLHSGIYDSFDDRQRNWQQEAEFAPKLPAADRDAMLQGWLQAIRRIKSNYGLQRFAVAIARPVSCPLQSLQ